jgi:uncharacterized protein
VQKHELQLPGEALLDDRWMVTSITGSHPGPAVFINAGIHGAEYPAIQTVIELGSPLDPAYVRGSVILMPVLNMPAFWERSMFLCPIDGKNVNRVFPGNPNGSYSEQLASALMREFIIHSDVHMDLHGGDMVEALVPFSIVQRGDTAVHQRAFEIATTFGLPYLLAVDRPVQSGSGTTTCAAAVASGIPSFIAEAGGIGQLDPESVGILCDGLLRVLAQFGMIASDVPPATDPVLLSAFEWLYSPASGMFYSRVAVNDSVCEGDVVGTLYGEHVTDIVSPVDGKVLFLTTSPAMKPEGLLMGIGVE